MSVPPPRPPWPGMLPAVVCDEVRRGVLDYLRTTLGLSDAAFEQALFDFLSGPQGMFRGPYLELALPFRKQPPGQHIPLQIQPGFIPFAHQLHAFSRLYSGQGHQPQHTLVTTGTGSGKTECFLYPIIDHCFRTADTPRIKTILLYPMNALASDQARRIAGQLWDDPRLRGRVSAGLYVGGDGRCGAANREQLIDRREILRNAPPAILLTNYRMLDFLLLRPEDRALWRYNSRDTLRYLVLDELHTFDGAQGSDVACLIRRLKARLSVQAGSLCCIGTSATIGSLASGQQAAARLSAFAQTLFGEVFGHGAVIREDRLSIAEALGETVDLDDSPDRQTDPALLDARRFASPDAYLSQQARLWLGSPELEPRALAERLRRHSFLRALLAVLDGQPQAFTLVAQRLADREPDFAELPGTMRWPVLQSFLALLAHARRVEHQPDGSTRELPLLQQRVQLWIRELRRLDRQLGPSPVFHWRDQPSQPGDAFLPMIHCRACGAHGWAGFQPLGESQLSPAQTQIGQAWLRRSEGACALTLPASDRRAGQSRVCPRCLAVGYKPTCPCGHASLAIDLHAELSEGERPRFVARCPACGSDDALSIIGGRAASLGSAAITGLFLSPYNGDKKLLAFTDSVQDASHRAGFFGARNYRFNFRTAVQSHLEAAPADRPPSLSALAGALHAFWLERLGTRDFISTFCPADLAGLADMLRFHQKKGEGEYRRLLQDLQTRISWELTLEYGLRSRRGRTLEVCGASACFPDPEALQRASEQLCLELSESLGLQPAPDLFAQGQTRYQPAEVRHFLAGLLERLRCQGGIDHSLLARYISDGGNRFQLSRRRNRLISPFGRHSDVPLFLCDQSGRIPFISLLRAGKANNWLGDWALRCFALERGDARAVELYRCAVRRLHAVGLLLERPVGKRHKAWALAPDQLRVSTAVRELRCQACSDRRLLPASQANHWLDRSCLHFRCPGHYADARIPGDNYYRRLYGSAQLPRIRCAEHTGLLSRAAREDLESRFKSNALGAPNVLVCTPTLELGVDVGDLSCTLACSVPPAPANYLQRVGRAGRKTGNALCLTVANARARDLYFYAEPLAMLAGEVRPPGCFLDAPEMLKRQFAAHLLDCWAQHEDLSLVPRIERQARFVLSESGRKKFPGRAIAYFQAHRAALSARFVALFAAGMQPHNQEALARYAASDAVAAQLQGAFDKLQHEIQNLERLRRELLARERELVPDAPHSESLQEELADVRTALKVVERLKNELRSRYPLQVLCDAGVLPNYAFPEPGVRLRAVVETSESGGQSQGKGKRKYRADEFVRPASLALRELAPGNTFYAEGLKMRINEIELGSRRQPLLERWQFCPVCNHSERVHEGDESLLCPRCEAPGWADAGQRHQVVHFRQARSFSRLLESVSVDDSDERESKRYRSEYLVEVLPANRAGARLIERVPFGWEYLVDLRLRELNFGQAQQPGSQFLAASHRLPSGFTVCLDCGGVADPFQRDPLAKLPHAIFCKHRKRPQLKVDTEEVFLLRELVSEALRILLPVSTVGIDEARHSFTAALHLGFREKLGGRAEHLGIVWSAEPDAANPQAPRRFLVVFDRVPGGTGYLAELWRSDGLGEILTLARDALLRCRCAQQSQADGCHLCILARAQHHEIPHISRRWALQNLQKILRALPQARQLPTLSGINNDELVESELELRFLLALEKHAQSQAGWSFGETLEGGKRCRLLHLPGQTWRIEPQVPLQQLPGSREHGRVDFVFWPANEDPRIPPVVVECDSLRWHALPGRERGRIGDDIRRRRPLIEGGRCQVFAVTWQDLDAFEGKRKASQPCLFDQLKLGLLAQLLQRLGVGLDRSLCQSGALPLLLAYLAQPDPELWRPLARAAAVALLGRGPQAERLRQLALRLRCEAAPFRAGPLAAAPGSTMLAWLREEPWLSALVSGAAAQMRGDLAGVEVLLRLFDDPRARADSAFSHSWQMFLQAWNLLQFHPGVEVCCSENLAEDAAAAPATPRPPAGRPEDAYRRSLPVYSLAAAAGGFSEVQAVEAEAWVEVPEQRLQPGMFVAQVCGRSMQPRIPDGAWCIFRHPVTGSREGRIVLVQHHALHDPESGGSYTVKRYRSEKSRADDGSWQHARIRLLPDNPDFPTIELQPEQADELAVIAELVAVLPATVEAGAAVEAEPAAPTADAGWAEAFELADPACQTLLRRCQAAGLPLPEVGDEQTDAQGRVVGELELSWPARRVGLVVGEQVADRAALAQHGWQILALEDGVEALLKAVVGEQP